MRYLCLCLLLLVPALTLLAQPKKDPPKAVPKIQYSMPLAITAGQKTKVVLRGTNLDTATEAKTTTANCTATIVGKARKAGVPNNYPANKLGDTECEVEIVTPKEFSGTVDVTISTPVGTSEVYTVSVSPKLTTEKEPNDSFKQAQEITLPAVVEGTFGRERDVDVFRFEGKAGQKVRIEVLAAKLGAPTDAILTVYCPDEKILQIVDDVDGSPDPKLEIELPKTGTYYLGLQEANDLGGGQFGYRLKVEFSK